jgi:hypothetical protein
MKNDYTIVRELNINQPGSVVYKYLRFLKNHKQLNTWFLKDPTLKQTSKNIDGQIGYILSYEENNALVQVKKK